LRTKISFVDRVKRITLEFWQNNAFASDIEEGCILAIEIRQTSTEKDNAELDQLLWDVLWQPLGFDRDVRKQFDLDSPQIELMAFDEGALVGALVAYYITDTEVELRHIAVKDDMQGGAVGRRLVDSLISLLTGKLVTKVNVYARSTSQGFYARCGFVPYGERFEHELFAKHGISIQPMHLEL
jgi:N-acetylglutamate synthase-like GNAT family acetyltransferase